MFRWALTNSHVSLHIPSEDRLSISTQRKRSGQPKRPRHSLVSIVSNLHLLLRVPSFARWPLTLHFFKRDVYKTWERWEMSADEPTCESLNIEADFGPDGTEAVSSSQSETPWGIHALPVDYKPLKEYAEKARNLFTSKREGSCVHCKEEMEPGNGLFAVCPNDECEAAGHLTCWSRHVLAGDDKTAVLPVQGTCPSCNGWVSWGTMMKELSLRVRAPQEVDKLLKKKRKAKAKAKADGDADAGSET